MSGNIDVLAATALSLAVLMVISWIISLAINNANVADVVWGAGLALVAGVSVVTGDGDSSRGDLIAAMTMLWGARTMVHAVLKSKGRGENGRYQAMRRQAGQSFPSLSLLTVFMLQGLVVWLVSLPLQLAVVPRSPNVGALAVAGAVVWGVGFFFGSVGDSQLIRFRARDDHESEILDTGLWSLTRHPNHFGDFCVWWGIFMVAAETTDARYAVIGPILMSALLLDAPRRHRARAAAGLSDDRDHPEYADRPGYPEYAERTAAFFPRSPWRPS